MAGLAGYLFDALNRMVATHARGRGSKRYLYYISPVPASHPDALLAAIDAEPKARARLAGLSAQNRFARFTDGRVAASDAGLAPVTVIMGQMIRWNEQQPMGAIDAKDGNALASVPGMAASILTSKCLDLSLPLSSCLEIALVQNWSRLGDADGHRLGYLGRDSSEFF